MDNKKPTQCERIRKYLQDFKSITWRQGANDLGIARVPNRICEMRKAGEEIDDVWVKVKNRYGESCDVKKYFYSKDREKVLGKEVG